MQSLIHLFDFKPFPRIEVLNEKCSLNMWTLFTILFHATGGYSKIKLKHSLAERFGFSSNINQPEKMKKIRMIKLGVVCTAPSEKEDHEKKRSSYWTRVCWWGIAGVCI